MEAKQIRRLKSACYSANLTMSVVSSLPPVLFLTFRSLYGISFSLLGFLVLVNFVTQLIVDLAFSFFSQKFNIEKAVKTIPILALLGFLIYGILPPLFPNFAYGALLCGTVVFSASAGFAEVLISPVIAALPAKDPDREMSFLHSVFAWGCVGVVAIAALYLLFFGGERWFLLVLAMAVVPAFSAILFFGAKLPKMETPQRATGALRQLCDPSVLLSVLCIFLGGAAECTMGQWASGYLEAAMGIPKIWGDLLGAAMFSVMLGMGRSLYAKFGRRILFVLKTGFLGAAFCYLVAAVSPVPLVGLVSCALTGFCTSMLWPGNLVVASDRNPRGGVFIYAIMAAGGDLGASVGPQLLGVVTDLAAKEPFAIRLAENLSLSPEQLGMKAGMLVGMLFPLMGFFVIWRLSRENKKI